MTFQKLKDFINSDLYRYKGSTSFKNFIIALITNPAFYFTFCLRCSQYFRQNYRLKFLYPLMAWKLHKLRIRYGLAIYSSTKIGSGFLIGHIGGIVINSESEIGNNCTILHGVTLGSSDRKDRPGAPKLGDCVYIGAGAKILGNVKVGDNVAIGANCVITKDVPENAVVVGVPGRVISKKGSYDLINNQFSTGG